MEERKRTADEAVRDSVLLNERINIKCPHCKENITASDLLRMEDPHNICGDNASVYISDGAKKPDMSKMRNHPGVTQAEMESSVAEASMNPLESLFSRYVALHYRSEYKDKKKFVWGAGSAPNAKVLFIGEAPGPEEGQLGVPFIGPAGVTLSQVLAATNIHRTKDCLLINTSLYEPDRVGTAIGKPSSKELLEQRPRIIEVIKLLNEGRHEPLKAIVCLGKFAWVQLMEKERLEKAVKAGKEVNMNDIYIGKIRGWHCNKLDDIDTPILCTYHPSYIKRILDTSADASKEPAVSEYFATFKDLKVKICQ